MADDNPLLPETISGNQDGDDSTNSDGYDDNDDDDGSRGGDAGATEAGIVRGVSRSVAQRAVAARSAGRSLAKLPSVGRLPRAPTPRALPKAAVGAAPLKAATKAVKVPVKSVARLTDRVSTGLDLWEMASSSGDDMASSSTRARDVTTKQQQQPAKRVRERYAPQIARASTFATSLVKNTILGGIVFESYCWIVTNSDSLLSSLYQQKLPTTTKDDSDEVEATSRVPIYKDVFETTPVMTHCVAGAVAGSMQGIFGSLWDTTALSFASRRLALPASLRPVLHNTAQHAVAHSILFGSYEGCKRLILQAIFDSDEDDPSAQQQRQVGTVTSLLPHQRLEYFGGVAIAGGLAGQFQHIASCVIEEAGATTIPTTPRALLSWSALPSLRSTVWAFPPSAIAFLAFEYGKDAVFELATDEDDDVANAN